MFNSYVFLHYTGKGHTQHSIGRICAPLLKKSRQARHVMPSTVRYIMYALLVLFIVLFTSKSFTPLERLLDVVSSTYYLLKVYWVGHHTVFVDMSFS